MRKMILRWLFGTDDVQEYIYEIRDACQQRKEHVREIEDHLETLYREKEDLMTMRKLIHICEKHGIDVDEELKQMEDTFLI